MGDVLTTVGELLRAKLDSGDGEWLSPEAVYAYYRENDPNPVAPLVLSWHIQNDVENFDTKLMPNPSDPEGQIPVVSKKCIEQFIEQRRKGLKVADEPTDPEQSKYRPEPREPTEPSGKTLTVTEAYKLYRDSVQDPMSLSWFRARMADGTITAVKADDQRTAGRAVWLVDADDLQIYCNSMRWLDRRLQSPPRPRLRWYGLTEAFATGRRHKIIPLTVNEGAFLRLVYSGKIASEREGTGKRPRFKVTRKALEDYFLQGKEVVAPEDTEPSLRPHEAYEYYCTKIDAPITSAEFWRLVDQGDIPSSRASRSRNAPRLVAKADVDVFIAAPVVVEQEDAVVGNVVWMTPEEVALLVRVEPQDVLDAFEAGDLPGKKIGKKVRFCRDEIEKWLSA